MGSHATLPTLPVGGPSLYRGCLAAAPVDGPTAVSFPSRPLPPLLSLLRHQRWYRASCRKREAWGAVPRRPQAGTRRPRALAGRGGAMFTPRAVFLPHWPIS